LMLRSAVDDVDFFQLLETVAAVVTVDASAHVADAEIVHTADVTIWAAVLLSDVTVWETTFVAEVESCCFNK